MSWLGNTSVSVAPFTSTALYKKRRGSSPPWWMSAAAGCTVCFRNWLSLHLCFGLPGADPHDDVLQSRRKGSQHRALVDRLTGDALKWARGGGFHTWQLFIDGRKAFEWHSLRAFRAARGAISPLCMVNMSVTFRSL